MKVAGQRPPNDPSLPSATTLPSCHLSQVTQSIDQYKRGIESLHRSHIQVTTQQEPDIFSIRSVLRSRSTMSPTMTVFASNICLASSIIPATFPHCIATVVHDLASLHVESNMDGGSSNYLWYMVIADFDIACFHFDTMPPFLCHRFHQS